MRSETQWSKVTLGEACSKIGSGATPRGGKNGYTQEGTALIRSQNVLDLAFSAAGLVHIDRAAADRLDGVTVFPGDVLLNITGQSVARCCRAPSSFLPARVNQHVAIIRADGRRLSNGFVQYALVARKQELLSLASAGATREALTKAMIEGFTIDAPPIDEQRRLTYVLDLLSNKIESNRRIAATLEAIAATLFKARFVDFVDHDDFVESEIGPIPRGWEVGSLGEIGISHRERTDGGSGLPYLGLDAMPKGSTVLSEWQTNDAPAGQSSTFSQGDILFGKLRPYFRKVGVAPIDGRCSTEILVLRTLDPAYRGFLLGHVSSQRFIDHCVSVSRGTRMPRSEWKDAGSFVVAVPPFPEAEEFNRVVDSVYGSIRARIHESRTLASLRDTLLPKLISGQIRVPEDAFQEVEAA